MTDYSKLTDTEINERLAGLMGWHTCVYDYLDADNKFVMPIKDWHPADDLNQMRLVEDRLIELGLVDKYVDAIDQTIDLIMVAKYQSGESYDFEIAHMTAHQKSIAALMAGEGK